MLKRLLIGAALMSCALYGRAQTQSVYASNVTDASGNLVASAQATFTPTVCPAPIGGFHKGGGGQGTLQPVYANVTGGAFSISLPDVNLTNPQNMGFDVQIVDNSTNATLLHYTCVQPSMTAQYASSWCSSSLSGCDFDKYIPSTPTVPAVTTSQSIVNNYNDTLVVDVDSFPGADLGAQIAAGDTQYAGQPVTFGITHSGTISTSFTLGAQHGLYIAAPVVFATTIQPTTDNTITCGPSAPITTTMSYSHPLADGSNAFFYVPQGAPEAERVKIQGCSFNGYGMNGGFIFDSFGPTQDITITDDRTSFASFYKQNGAGASNPSLRLSVTGSTCDWTGAPLNGSAACVLNYGAMQHAIVSHNHFMAPLYGAEFLADSGSGLAGSAFPSQADIEASGMGDDLMEGNECENTQSCLWTSVSYRVSLIGNIAHTCTDVCFDFESGSHNVAQGNTAYDAKNGDFAQEYGGFNNSFLANTAIGGLGFYESSPTAYTIYDGNSYSNSGSVGVWLYLESGGVFLRATHNNILDGAVAYDNGYVGSQFFGWNTYYFDQKLPTSNFGSPTGSACGTFLGNFQDASFVISEDETMVTTVAQTQPALCVGNSASNTIPSAFFIHPTIIGPWAVDAALNTAGQNSAHPFNVVLRDAQFDTGIIDTSQPNGSQVNVICSTGRVGASNSSSLTVNATTGSGSSATTTTSTLACN